MIFEFADERNRPFHTLSASIALLAAVLHVAFLGLFLWADATVLAMANVVSVLAHVWAFILVGRGHQIRGLVVIVLEVVTHSIVATYYIGWASGFHYYFILVVPVIALSSTRRTNIKILLVSITIAAYIAFDIFLRQNDASRTLSDEIIEVLYYFNITSVMVTLAFIAFYYYYLISQAEIALVIAANTDPLTKLSNRRCFMQAIEKEMVRVHDGPAALSFIICDLDYFKAINDRYGHDAGDMVLKSVSVLLTNEIRQGDKLSRWGGEEFLIMLPDATRNEASVIAEHLRKKVENLRFTHTGENFHLSMTMGVTSLMNSENPEHAIARADTGLYEGKNSGRNRVVLV